MSTSNFNFLFFRAFITNFKGWKMTTIEEFMTYLQSHTSIKISRAEIARGLKTERSNITHRIKSKSECKLSEMRQILEHLNISNSAEILNSILEKDGRLFKENVESMPDVESEIQHVRVQYFPDVYLSAGYGVEVLDERSEYIVIDERFLMSERGMRVNPKNCKMVRISGNSMFPEYHHGDRVIIDESDTNLTDGQIYAFRYDGQCYVKEINRAGNRIKCISVNKEYEPFFIERDVDFKVFGRIIPRVRL